MRCLVACRARSCGASRTSPVSSRSRSHSTCAHFALVMPRPPPPAPRRPAPPRSPADARRGRRGWSRRADDNAYFCLDPTDRRASSPACDPPNITKGKLSRPLIRSDPKSTADRSRPTGAGGRERGRRRDGSPPVSARPIYFINNLDEFRGL